MKKICSFFLTFLPVMLCGIGLNVIFSLIAYGLDFDSVTAKYVFPSVTATLFFVFFISSLAFAGLFAVKSKHLPTHRVLFGILRIGQRRSRDLAFGAVASALPFVFYRTPI